MAEKNAMEHKMIELRKKNDLILAEEQKRYDKMREEAKIIHEDKVAEMKAKIESGNYRINHGAVSDKLVDDAIDELF